MVALRSFATIEYEAGQSAIRHENGERVTTVYADIDRSVVDTATINGELEAFIADAGMLVGRTDLRVRYGGELEQQQEAMGDFGIAALLAMLGIAVVLILLFDSVIQPLLILAVIPFGLVGVLAGFALQGFELSLIALIGILGLAGVLVNDAVVLVSRLGDLRRAEGCVALDAEQIAFGASQRLRPIVITSVTTVAGLMPTAYGMAGNAAFIAPMVMAIAWGVLLGDADHVDPAPRPRRGAAARRAALASVAQPRLARRATQRRVERARSPSARASAGASRAASRSPTVLSSSSGWRRGWDTSIS